MEQMDFFERQNLAHKNTRFLVVLFVAAVLAIIAVLYFSAIAFFGSPVWDPDVFFSVVLGTLAVVGLGSLFKILQLSQGGSAVAAMLGGQLVDVHTTDPRLRQLLNIVEEMSIASGLPVPEVYLLAEDASINAFAAGHGPGDAVVGVTRGAVERLTRDELQGVIAHEFSHILNGDMKLNIRLMGVLFGILCIAVAGQILMRSGFWTGGASGGSRDRNSGNLGLAIMLAGLVLLIVGYIGVFFAKLIKAAVSRQREFLADAAAVQFTRNPSGIAGALHKIGGLSAKISSPHAEEASHLFFGNGLGDSWLRMLATHPPIEDRIRAIDPAFDPTNVKKIRPPRPPEDGSAAPVRRNWLGHAGVPGPDHLMQAAAMISALPEYSAASAHELHGAAAMVYSFLLSGDAAVRERQIQSMTADPAGVKALLEQFAKKEALSYEQQITLVDLAIPTLRQLSPEQYRQFRDNVERLIRADGELHLPEFLLEKILVRHLDMHFTKTTGAKVVFRQIQPLLPDIALLLGGLALLANGEAEDRAYAAGVRELLVNAADPALKQPSAVGLEEVGRALDRIATASPDLKRRILTACGAVVMDDSDVSLGQAQLLRAIADAVDCPVPPFVKPAEQ